MFTLKLIKEFYKSFIATTSIYITGMYKGNNLPNKLTQKYYYNTINEYIFNIYITLFNNIPTSISMI